MKHTQHTLRKLTLMILLLGSLAYAQTADFTVNITSGTNCAPVVAQFVDLSTGGITNWFWDFGDGATSTSQSPVHTYSSAGNYTVTLTVFDGSSTASESKANFITVHVPPTANFTTTATPSDCNAPFNLQFVDQTNPGSSQIVSFQWTFGDGGASQSQNPSYTYNSNGEYDVLFTVTDANGCVDDEFRSNFVRVGAPDANLSADIISGAAPLSVQFSDLTNDPSVNGWSWNFGDGAVSTQQNPSHVYQTPGSYTVSLTINTTGGCSDTETINGYINVSTQGGGGSGGSPINFRDSLAAYSLGDLGDVDLAGISNGETLVWDGAKFEAGSAGGSGLAAPLYTTGNTNSDYVGVGILSPTAKMHVSGTNLGTDAGLAIEATDDNSPNGYSLYVKGNATNNGNQSHHTQLTTGSADSRLSIKASDDADKAPRLQLTGPNESGNPGWAIFDYGSQLVNLPDASFKMRYMRSSGGALDMIHADADRGVYLAPTLGNVGVGTNNPQEKLHVDGTIRSSDLAGGGVVHADANGNLFIGASSRMAGPSSDEFDGVKDQVEVQSTLIAAQQSTISDLEERLSKIEELLASRGLMDEKSAYTGSSLSQNMPNPATAKTQIPYYLASYDSDARIVVFHAQTGQIVRSERLVEAGQSSFTLSVDGLTAGVYIYTLIVDGKQVDSKKMIVQ